MTFEKSLLAIIVTAVLVFAAITWHESRIDLARLESTIATQQQIINAAESREKDRDTALNATLAQINAVKKSAQTPEQILRDLPEYLHLPEPITLNSQSPDNTQVRKGIGPKREANEFTDSQATPSNQTEANADSLSQIQPPRANSTQSSKPPLSQTQTPNSSTSTPNASELFPPQGSSSSSNTQSQPPDSPNEPADSHKAEPAQYATIPAADLRPLFDYIQDCRACQAQLAAARADLSDEKTHTAALTRERNAAIQAAKGGNLWQRLKHNAKWLAAGAALTLAISHLH
jgi:hypothetical protein